MSSWKHISVNPIAGALGAAAWGGVHLGELGESCVQRGVHCVSRASGTVFCHQDITRDQHKAFGRRFGTLQIDPLPAAAQGRRTSRHARWFCTATYNIRTSRKAWHSDVTFVDAPPLGSVLRCVVAPEFGGDTMWASMYAADQALSDKMQRMLSDLVAIHDTASHLLSWWATKTDHLGGTPSPQSPIRRASCSSHASGERP